ncbi:MAG: hypothetical protein ACPGVU_06900 [Limisphaerales bacterium]
MKSLLSSGARVFDLYDLMDRMGTVTFRFTKKYINIPLTAAATGLLGREVGGEGFDWQKLIYTPLIITAAICAVGVALKIPNFLSAAARNFARLQGHLNMVQLKRNRRHHHAGVLWRRHFVYHTRERYSEEQMAESEKQYGLSQKKLVDELDAGLSEETIDHLELENLTGNDRREMLEELGRAMEFETPTSPGIETCESGFYRTLMFSLRSDDAQRETQEKSGYVFQEYAAWLRETFFDSSHPPLAKKFGTDSRIARIMAQLKKSAVGHDLNVRPHWYVFPGVAQAFWHKNTIRKVNLKVGGALARLTKRYRVHLTVQAILWPGNWKHWADEDSEESTIGEELREAGKQTIRQVYGETRPEAMRMLDRAMLNNFMQTKGLRVLADFAYCSGEGIEQSYLTDLSELGCSGSLLDYHRGFVEQAKASMACLDAWLKKHRPELLDEADKLALVRDAFHRNVNGFREAVERGGSCCFNVRRSMLGGLMSRLGRSPRAGSILDGILTEESCRQLREERDAMRMYDVIAHLEYETYRDLVEKLGEY